MTATATEVAERYARAQRERDLELLVSCWHPDVEIVHPLRPSMSWSGLDLYRRTWERIYRTTQADGRYEVVSLAVVGDTIYRETLIEASDGVMVPCMSVLQVEDGKIRRGRVYTGRPADDAGSMDDFVATTYRDE